ncbi:MAG: S8 family serine peptidase, partial [Planctomycetota bacterium]|nr:S8 family serine peptidase [Planctomycetota bacterium]
MRRQVLVSLLVLLSVVGFARAADFSAFAFSGLAQEKSGLYKPGELIVRFSDTDRQQPAGVPIIGPRTKRAIRSAISDYVVSGATVHKECDRAVAGLAVVKLPEGTTVVDALIWFNRSANVLYAEPNYKYKFLVVPNDPNFRRQWALNNTGQTGGTRDADIDAPEAWDIQTGSSDIIVAVIDSGVDYRHPDLAGNMWTNTGEVGGISGYDDDDNGYVDDVYGYDFLNDDNDPADDLFHGTHCAGVIGADTDNAKGVAGVCWDVSIMALKVGDSNGVDLDAAIEAIGYAAAMGARVINASWGGYNDSQGL